MSPAAAPQGSLGAAPQAHGDAAQRIARVVLDSPLPQLDRLLDYRVPPTVEGVIPGVRVTVQLGGATRTASGFVVELTDQQQFPGPLRDVVAVVSPVPVLRPEVWALARAVADRAAGSASDVLRVAIPRRQARVEKAWLGRMPVDREPVSAVPVDGYGAVPIDGVDGRVALRAIPGVVRVGTGAGATWVGRWALTFAQLAVATVARGDSAILVVPDYRDQEQLLAAIGSLVPADAVVRWDARQTEPDRVRSLLRAMGGPRIVVGTRNAVYAPAERLGLLAVWDDGDPLLAEPLTPYAHARDVALIRNEQQGGSLVFAGHTRTTDVQRLVEVGYLQDAVPATPVKPHVVPTANMQADDRLAEQARIPSFAWRTASDALRHGPVLVQVARPGFSPGLRCAECGTAAHCAACGGPLRQARAGAVPTCAWCGTPSPTWRCPECRSTRLRAAGIGSVRTADELGRAFPGVRVIVSDGEHPELGVDDRPAVVVATRGAEPIAAGGYAAVLLLDGDRMVARETLRVGEDVLRWWSDAAALAADRAPVVLVGVGGTVAAALSRWDQPAYAATELAERRMLRFPPAVRIATLTAERDVLDEALAALPTTAELVGVTPVEEGRSRALLRFDYAHGGEIAKAVRAEVVRLATGRRSAPRAPQRGDRRARQPLPLRAHFDDPRPFDE